MKKNFNLAGPERKALVKKIEEYTGDKPQYLGTPTYSYQIGVFNLSRYGELSWEDYADETAKKLVEWLKISGFTSEEEKTQEAEETADEAAEEAAPETEDTSEIIDEEPDSEAPAELDTTMNIISTEEAKTRNDAPDADENDNASEEQTDKESDIVNEEQAEEGDEGQTETGESQTEQPIQEENPAETKAEETDADDNHLTISVPDDLTGAQFDTLTKVVESKATLLKHAFKTDNVNLEREDGKINFPWFAASDGDHTNGYTIFLQKLICFAKEAKRVTAQDHPVENEKYAFRTWLLRLGLIGPEYKGARRVLLENLTGSSAFRDGKRTTATVNGDEQGVSA